MVEATFFVFCFSKHLTQQGIFSLIGIGNPSCSSLDEMQHSSMAEKRREEGSRVGGGLFWDSSLSGKGKGRTFKCASEKEVFS